MDLSTLELAYCGAVLLFTFALRGSLGFGGAVGLLLGDRIHSGLSQAAFHRLVCAALFLCGVPLLLK